MLAVFEVLGDKDTLARLQTLFPNDPKVVVVSCLKAVDPDSPWLTLLEALEPNNSLPHLLRAMLWAKEDDVMRVKKELQRALSKGALTTHLRERQIRAINLALKGHDREQLMGCLSAHLDEGYFDGWSRIGDILVGNPALFGDTNQTSFFISRLVAKMNQMEHFETTHVYRRDQFEVAFLQKIPPGSFINGVQVGQRLKQLSPELETLEQWQKQMETVMEEDPGGEVHLRQFLVHLRDHGMAAAVAWLLGREG